MARIHAVKYFLSLLAHSTTACLCHAEERIKKKKYACVQQDLNPLRACKEVLSSSTIVIDDLNRSIIKKARTRAYYEHWLLSCNAQCSVHSCSGLQDDEYNNACT